jgi:hypothetical protein
MTIHTKEPLNVEKSNLGCPRSQHPKSKAKGTDTYKKKEEILKKKN